MRFLLTLGAAATVALAASLPTFDDLLRDDLPVNVRLMDDEIIVEGQSGDSYHIPIPLPGFEEDGVEDQEEPWMGAAFPEAEEALNHPHHRYKDIDLTSMTILEILNSTLYTPLHPEPELLTLPIRKFSKIANYTQSLGEPGFWNMLYKHENELEGIEYTLFIPDDKALTPPRRRRHGGGGHHRHHQNWGPIEDLAGASFEPKQDAMEEDFWERFESQDRSSALFPSALLNFAKDEDDDDEDSDHPKLPKKARKKLLKLANAILYYHSVPLSRTLAAIGDQSTLETRLPSFIPDEEHGKLGPWHRLRITTSPLERWIPGQDLRGVDVNFYASVRGRSIRAKNGYIHLLSKPLFPPLSAFREMLLFPSAFSTTTSSIQEVELHETLNPSDPYLQAGMAGADPHRIADDLLKELKTEGRQWSIFVPVNRAWEKVPMGLQAFLHSPNAHAKALLKAVLDYHTLPDVHFHTDHHPSIEPYHIGTDEDVPVTADDPIWNALVEGEGDAMGMVPPEYIPASQGHDLFEAYYEMKNAHLEHPRRRYTVDHYSIPSALALPPKGSDPHDTPEEEWETKNVTAAVVKYRMRGPLGGGYLQRRLIVQSYRGKDGEAQWDAVTVPDVPVRAGALHLTSRVIVPPFRKHFKGDDV